MERGRPFTEQDLEAVRAAIVNESFAKKYFSGIDPMRSTFLVRK